MKYRALFLFLVAALVSSQAHAASGEFCVQTFNVYATAYAGGKAARLSKIADSLTNEPCDSIQFQELWQAGDYRRFSTDFSRAQMSLVQADSLRTDKAMIGLVSAFRGTTARSYSEIYLINNEDGVLDWFRGLTGVQKGLSAIEAKLTQGPTLLFLNTHTHPTNEAIRAAQMIQLITHNLIQSPNAANLPVVFTADLNATPDSLEISLLKNVLLLRDAYLDTHENYGDLCTYCESNPLSWGGGDRVIDFTLFRSSPTVTLRALKSEINLKGSAEAPLSDHYGVRSQLAFSEHDSILLPADSALVLDRKAAAIKALVAAREVLVKAQKPVFETAITQVDSLLEKFRTRLPESAEMIFRTP
ncbi:MAG: hypothetical protein AB7K68_01440 [Bacteriovoracia bacterium]